MIPRVATKNRTTTDPNNWRTGCRSRRVSDWDEVVDKWVEGRLEIGGIINCKNGLMGYHTPGAQFLVKKRVEQ